eukprot:365750-Chlamydomonas_euryale.AAC.11
MLSCSAAGAAAPPPVASASSGETASTLSHSLRSVVLLPLRAEHRCDDARGLLSSVACCGSHAWALTLTRPQSRLCGRTGRVLWHALSVVHWAMLNAGAWLLCG